MLNIEQFLDLANYSDSRKNRRKGSGGTQEFFTPYSIVKRMGDKITPEDWSNHDKTFCEPSFGHGNFIIGILWDEMPEDSINETPRVEIEQSSFTAELTSEEINILAILMMCAWV